MLEDDVGAAFEAGAASAGAGIEVTVAGVGDVEAAAVAAMVPLRSHGFGGEAIVQIGGLRVHRYTTRRRVNSLIRFTRESNL